MHKYTRYLMFFLSLCVTDAVAQTTPQPAAGSPAFAQQELDQMLAPIAPCPDYLPSHILVTVTYPSGFVQAGLCSSGKRMNKGDAAAQPVANQNWDPSVKSLVVFSQLLLTLGQKSKRTERFGDAHLAQQWKVVGNARNSR